MFPIASWRGRPGKVYNLTAARLQSLSPLSHSSSGFVREYHILPPNSRMRGQMSGRKPSSDYGSPSATLPLQQPVDGVPAHPTYGSFAAYCFSVNYILGVRAEPDVSVCLPVCVYLSI